MQSFLSHDFTLILVLKIRGDVPYDQLQELDLSKCNLTNIDLSKFPRLEKLSLKGNTLTANTFSCKHHFHFHRSIAFIINF